jgi:hypothetical protein
LCYRETIQLVALIEQAKTLRMRSPVGGGNASESMQGGQKHHSFPSRMELQALDTTVMIIAV